MEVESIGTLGMVIARTVDEPTTTMLLASNIVSITELNLIDVVATWDWPKQNRALLGMLHYLAHIEQNPGAVERLLRFIDSCDPHRESVLGLT
jgi:hypothetical protein